MLINTRTIKRRRQIFRRAPPDHSLWAGGAPAAILVWLCHFSRRRARTMYTPRHFAFQTGFDNDEDATVENKAPAVRAPLAASNPRRFPRVYSISCPAESALLRLLHFFHSAVPYEFAGLFLSAHSLSLLSAIITHSLRLIIFPFLICANKGGGNLAGA